MIPPIMPPYSMLLGVPQREGCSDLKLRVSTVSYKYLVIFCYIYYISQGIYNFSLSFKKRGPLEWHYLHTTFHENLRRGSKVISGGQTGDLISLLSFLDSRLNMKPC
jgi:hypothetical protein